MMKFCLHYIPLITVVLLVGCNSSTTMPTELTSNASFTVTRLNEGKPIITAAMFQALGARKKEGQNINGVSVIRIPSWIKAADRADPSAIYYLYFAHHQGGYIRMAWAAHIEGPWQLYDVGNNVELGDRGVLDLNDKPMIISKDLIISGNHIASPNVHVDHQRKRIILYFHASSTKVYGKRLKGQKTLVATSAYGLEFSGQIEPVILGRAYFSVFSYRDNLYAFDNGANLYKARDPQAPWEIPTNWDLTQELWTPSINNGYQDDINASGQEFATLRVRHVNALVKGDTLYAFYSRRGVNPPERIMMSTTDLAASDDYQQWDPSYPPEEIYRAHHGWEGGQFDDQASKNGFAPEDVDQLRDPYIFEDNDNELYLFYTGRGENSLGVLHLRPMND